MTKRQALAEVRRRWGARGWVWVTLQTVKLVGTRTLANDRAPGRWDFGRGAHYEPLGYGATWDECFESCDAKERARELWGSTAWARKIAPNQYEVGYRLHDLAGNMQRFNEQWFRGASWDEAFAAAGAPSSSPPEPEEAP